MTNSHVEKMNRFIFHPLTLQRNVFVSTFGASGWTEERLFLASRAMSLGTLNMTIGHLPAMF